MTGSCMLTVQTNHANKSCEQTMWTNHEIPTIYTKCLYFNHTIMFYKFLIWKDSIKIFYNFEFYKLFYILWFYKFFISCGFINYFIKSYHIIFYEQWPYIAKYENLMIWPDHTC